ncbi:hypothetical protein MY4824_000972 [Beauveria thailandica]
MLSSVSQHAGTESQVSGTSILVVVVLCWFPSIQLVTSSCRAWD